MYGQSTNFFSYYYEITAFLEIDCFGVFFVDVVRWIEPNCHDEWGFFYHL